VEIHFALVLTSFPAGYHLRTNSWPQTELTSKSKPHYDRPSVGQSGSVSRGPRPDFRYCHTFAVFSIWGALSDKRTGLSFTIAAGPRQRSHSQVRVPRDSWPYFTVSNSSLPPTWTVRSLYLYHPGTGYPSYTPRHWIPLSSPPVTSRATVEVFEHASTRAGLSSKVVVRVTLRLAVYRQSHCLGVKLLAHDDFFSTEPLR
jgi:hypothetical protein